MITPPKALAEKAVKSMRLYLGAIGATNLRVEQRLYKRVMKDVQAVATKTNQDLGAWWPLVEREARNRGAIRSSPGKDY